jgi:hypothetical protein
MKNFNHNGAEGAQRKEEYALLLSFGNYPYHHVSQIFRSNRNPLAPFARLLRLCGKFLLSFAVNVRCGHGKPLFQSIQFSLLALLLAPILSCASLSPLAAPPADFPLHAPTPQDLRPRWAAFVPGIDYLEARIAKPRLQLWALRAELDNPDLEIVVNRGGENTGIIPSTTVSGFVRDHNCVAGINATPFDRIVRRSGEPLAVAGIALSEGVLVAAPVPRYDALVFYQDGSAAIVSQAALGGPALADIRNAVGGFRTVLRDGAIAERLLDQAGKGRPPRHPRSAAGVSADGKTLCLLVIDGRRPGSVGATERELAVLLRQLGADDGLNLDGGGSTTLALRYGDGTIRPANTPAAGKERPVAACLGIRSGATGH